MSDPIDIDRLIEKAVRRRWLVDTGTGAYAVTRAGKRRAWFFNLARKVSRWCRTPDIRILARRRVNARS